MPLAMVLVLVLGLPLLLALALALRQPLLKPLPPFLPHQARVPRAPAATAARRWLLPTPTPTPTPTTLGPSPTPTPAIVFQGSTLIPL